MWKALWYSKVTDYGKERPRDPPSIFICVKPSLVPTIPPALRETKRSPAETRRIIPDGLFLFNNKDRIVNFEDLKKNLHAVDFNGISIVSYNAERTILYYSGKKHYISGQWII